MRRDRLSTNVAALVILALACGGIVAGTVAFTASACANAARARRRRRDGCPFENDDDAARPLAQETRAVIAESVALLRMLVAALRPVPRDWRTASVRTGLGPLVVLVPGRGGTPAAMAPLGHRLARDLGASIHVEPRGRARSITVRAERLAVLAATLAAAAPGRPLLLVGHGTGGLVVRRAATALPARRLRVVTLATPQRCAGEPEARDPLVDRAEVVNLYSLHDALVVPPERCHLPGAFNVALRDEGHFGILLAARPYTILAETLADLRPRAEAS